MYFDISCIKKDIIELSPKNFYLKYIIKSANWYLKEYKKLSDDEFIEKMDRFNEIIAECFDVSYRSAQIVGSAKLGVSLSPEKPFRQFITESDDENEQESDIDIAIVSNTLFMDIWDKIREERKKAEIPKYISITESIFKGYINDEYFKDLDGMRKKWEEKVSSANILLQQDLLIAHKISYRIYRNWEDLEEYQIDGIKQIKERMIRHEI